MDRRRFLLASLAAAVAAPLGATAQQTGKVARIGYLAIDVAADDFGRQSFLQGLRGLGYVEGRDFVMETRDARGEPGRFPALAAELVQAKIDVIVAGGGTLGALAAKQATQIIPIVFPIVGDPVADGLVASLAKPGGNLTGSSLVLQTVDKLLELLKQAVPRMTRVALLFKPDAAPEQTLRDYVDAATRAAQTLGLRLQLVEARGPQDFARAFAEMRKGEVDGLAVVTTPVFSSDPRRIVKLATTNRLPTVFSQREYVDAGGLISYGPERAELFRRAATYVDKILKGAKPADLPVEQPNKFELVINVRTAKALGLTIPPSLLLRADQVIE